MATREEPHDDEVAVVITEEIREPNVAAVELPLAVRPTENGMKAGLALLGGIEELTKVTADEVCAVWAAAAAAATAAAIGVCLSRRTCSSWVSPTGLLRTQTGTD